MDLEIWGINSCMNSKLSPFQSKDGKIKMPWYYLEDFYQDFFEENKIIHGQDNDGLLWVLEAEITVDELYNIRAQSYSAENWYPTLEEFTYPSVIIQDDGNLNSKKLEDAIQRSKINFGKNPKYFVRSESASPKDIHPTCIVDNLDQALKIYRDSERISVKSTQSPCIMLRQVDDKIKDKIEMRCFVYHGKVRAISQNCDRQPFRITKSWITNTIKENCKKWKNIIFPYTDCTFDTATDSNGNSIIIEVNSFGGDSYAGSALFSWNEDYYLICHTEDRVIVRFNDHGTLLISP